MSSLSLQACSRELNAGAHSFPENLTAEEEERKREVGGSCSHSSSRNKKKVRSRS